jgi:hypothetical protein
LQPCSCCGQHGHQYWFPYEVTVVWVVTTCSSAEVHWRFVGTFSSVLRRQSGGNASNFQWIEENARITN